MYYSVRKKSKLLCVKIWIFSYQSIHVYIQSYLFYHIKKINCLNYPVLSWLKGTYLHWLFSGKYMYIEGSAVAWQFYFELESGGFNINWYKKYDFLWDIKFVDPTSFEYPTGIDHVNDLNWLHLNMFYQ